MTAYSDTVSYTHHDLSTILEDSPEGIYALDIHHNEYEVAVTLIDASYDTTYGTTYSSEKLYTLLGPTGETLADSDTADDMAQELVARGLYFDADH